MSGLEKTWVPDAEDDHYRFEDGQDPYDYLDDGTMPGNVAELREAVVGHRIVKVEENAELGSRNPYWARKSTGLLLTLDDGRQVALQDTDDCCAYTELLSVIRHLDSVDHVITGVESSDWFERWHIFADLGEVLELQVGWSAGNPFYYGYGFQITVTEP